MNLTGKSQIDQARIEWALRLKFSPMPDITMKRMTTQLNSFRIGDLWLAARTWEVMIERDSELAANIFKRCEDVAALDWEIMSDGSPEGDRHACALKYFYDHASVTNALDQDEIGDVSKLIWNIAFAHAMKYSTHEMLLRVDNAAAQEVTCEFRLTPVWFFECRRGYLGWLQHVFDVYGQPLELGEWLPAVGYGHMRACSVLYVFKHNPLQDWLLYSERYGFPHVQLLTDATKGSQEWNDLMNAYEKLGNDGALITNKTVEIRPIDVATKGELPFRAMVEDVNRAYAKLFRGSDLATSSRAKGQNEGHAVGASVQKGEKDILLASDARWATPILNYRVDRPIIRYLFNSEPRAWFKLLPPADDDAQSDLLTAQFCVQNGVPLAVSTVRERFNWPEPQPGEPVLTPGSAPVSGAAKSALGQSPANPNGNGHATSESQISNPQISNRAGAYAPGATPGPDQRPDPRMPGGNKPLTRWNYPGGQENAL
jgi:phage gp29-like protein